MFVIICMIFFQIFHLIFQKFFYRGSQTVVGAETRHFIAVYIVVE